MVESHRTPPSASQMFTSLRNTVHACAVHANIMEETDEDATPNRRRPCSGLRQELLDCLRESDCVKMVGTNHERLPYRRCDGHSIVELEYDVNDVMIRSKCSDGRGLSSSVEGVEKS